MLAASTDVTLTANTPLEQGNAARGAGEMINEVEQIIDGPDNCSLGSGITSRRVVTADWNFNAGEQVHALETARFTPSLPFLHCHAQSLRSFFVKFLRESVR